MDRNLTFKNFNNIIKQKHKTKLSTYLKKINSLEWPEFLKCYKKNYKYSYNKKNLKKYKKFNHINIVGMGGSILGTKAIYNFLNYKIKKKISFFENLSFLLCRTCK